MGRKKYTDNPSVEDTIIFDLNTENDDGLLVNPFSVEKISIFYLSRGPGKNNIKFEKKFNNVDLQEQYENYRETVAVNPTPENLRLLRELKGNLDKTALKTDIYYKEAQFAMSTPSPIWTADGKVRNIVNFVNEKKEVLSGRFYFAWLPKGMREGTYIVRWEWKLEENGSVRAAEKTFTISAAPDQIRSNNLNLTGDEKYDFLLKKYIPTMYFVKTKQNDLTPKVIEKLNKAVGQGFKDIENSAIRLFTLLDPDTIKTDFLPLMANAFGLTLRSEDPDAWRNQIRYALNLYKKKGTYEGLRQALDKAGIVLLKLTNLWQVVSKHKWTDGFLIDKDINLDTLILGYLTKKPINGELKIEIRSAESKDYMALPKEIVSLREVQAPETRTAVVWQGGNITPQIPLIKGDVVKITCVYKQILESDLPSENYIASLPLSDQRDETSIKYPVKNWNIKLIEEDDPLFTLLINEHHPFSGPVVFGKIRTTFLYSEKVFNMDTFNGSLFNSNSPCDLDKDFVDTCHGGRSSKFNVHLEFENVSDEKIKEAKEIIIDYSPFHAMLHNMVISSKTIDYVLPPVESIKNNIKEKNRIEKVNVGETITCKIKYRDGRVIEGRL